MVKCFDVATIVIKSATDDFNGKWIVDPGKLEIFKGICSSVDRVLAEGCDELVGFDVDVDTDSHEIIIGVEFNKCKFKMSNEITIAISNVGNDSEMIRFEMRFNGVWVKNE